MHSMKWNWMLSSYDIDNKSKGCTNNFLTFLIIKSSDAFWKLMIITIQNLRTHSFIVKLFLRGCSDTSDSLLQSKYNKSFEIWQHTNGNNNLLEQSYKTINVVVKKLSKCHSLELNENLLPTWKSSSHAFFYKHFCSNDIEIWLENVIFIKLSGKAIYHQLSNQILDIHYFDF